MPRGSCSDKRRAVSRYTSSTGGGRRGERRRRGRTRRTSLRSAQGLRGDLVITDPSTERYFAVSNPSLPPSASAPTPDALAPIPKRAAAQRVVSRERRRPGRQMSALARPAGRGSGGAPEGP